MPPADCSPGHCPPEDRRPEQCPAEHRQLLLPFGHAPGYDARDFLPDSSNNQALRWLDSDWPEDRLALWGPPGCGKSHLLHIWSERTGAGVLSGHALRDLDAAPQSGALAIDDADTVRSEALLLHLLNTARERRLKVLLAGREAPSRWPIALPDLTSRLRATTAVEIRAPGDDLLAALLLRLLSDRQLSAAQQVRDRLLFRLPRSAEALREAVARLDRASLRFGKAITRALADSVLAEGGFAVSDAAEVVTPGAENPSDETQGFL